MLTLKAGLRSWIYSLVISSYFEPTPGETGSWTAELNNANQWLQVDVGTPQTRITGVATQSRSDMNQWVTKYKLQYRNNSTAFQYYKENGQVEDKVKSIC